MGFEPVGVAPEPMRADEIVPRGQDFATVGHLYRSCARGLAHLAEKLGEDRLFIGPAFHQAEESAFGWPMLGAITNLAQAEAAIERIVEQGEGATGDWDDAPFGRFLAVRDEYLAMRREDPDFDPVHPVIAAGMRAVEGIEPDVYITDPATGACSDLFNAVYELLLQMIARYFAFGHETPEERAVLANAAVDLMFRAIKPLGCLLARLPVGPDHPGPRPEPTSSSLPGELPAPAPPRLADPLLRAARGPRHVRGGAASGVRRGPLAKVAKDLRATASRPMSHVEAV